MHVEVVREVVGLTCCHGNPFQLSCDLIMISSSPLLSVAKAKSIEEVLSEKDNLEQERVWVVHKDGFSLGTVVRDSPKQSTTMSIHYSLVVNQVS